MAANKTEHTDKKLFLLDAMALIYRAHFAFIRTPRITSTGLNTSAVFGFTNVLLDILKAENPSHIGIVYDTSKPTFRHEQYEAYKANRQQQPEDIAIAIPYIRKIADGFGIPNIMLDGFEADDLIGCLAKKAARNGFTVYMMTPDKDFAQLVEPNILQYKPAYMGKPAEILGVNEVLEKWNIDEPEQVIDVLGLMGDASDNIPGIPGVGEKTAKKLIKEFGSVEKLIENSNKLTGKVKLLVEEHAEQALLSKKLATIDINCPVDFDEKKLLIEAPDHELLRQVFTELEFRTMAKRVLGDEATSTDTLTSRAQASAQLGLFDTPVSPGQATADEEKPSTLKTIHDVPHEYKLVSTEDEREELLKLLKSVKSFSFDTETSTLNAHDCDIVGFSVATEPGKAYFVALPLDHEKAKEILKPFKKVFEDKDIEKIAQNAKFDMMVLEHYDVQVRGPIFDTMLAHYLIEPEMRHNLNLLSENYLHYSPVPIENLIGKKGKKQLSMADLKPEDIADYAAEDADLALQLKEKLEPQLKEVKAEKLFHEVEIPLIPVLSEMERQGVRIDKDALNAFSIQLQEEMLEIEKDVYDLAGGPFNINSPMQLGEILFDKLKLDPKAKRTAKSKQYSTNEEVLANLAAKHDIAQKILDYRSLQKLKSTYVDALPQLINKRTGRIHTSYNQAVTATGRLSSTDPNLQNIPIRTERGREIRKAFIPRDEKHTILSADYSQIELRLIAEMSGDEGMIKAFNEKYDIHAATAAKIYNVAIEGVAPEMRRRAKMVNFGIIYGISAFGLAQRLKISRTEAAHLIEQYNKQYPKIQQYMQDQITFAHKHGYVETLLGRRRYLRDINSANATTRGYAERNAINAPIQGTAADMIKVAMIRIHEAFEKKNLKSKMILQVHDELVFDALKSEIDEVREIVEDKMKHALDLNIPIEVEMGTGENWLEAH